MNRLNRPRARGIDRHEQHARDQANADLRAYIQDRRDRAQAQAELRAASLRLRIELNRASRDLEIRAGLPDPAWLTREEMLSYAVERFGLTPEQAERAIDETAQRRGQEKLASDPQT
jgi:hypothetical protein